MSSVASIIKEAGPFVVALAGMGAAFFTSRNTGRESRHHVRVEALYQEILENLEARRDLMLDRSQQSTLSLSDDGAPKPYEGFTPRVRLYASPEVEAAWIEVLMLLRTIERADATSREAMFGPFLAADDSLRFAMRADLGVPRQSVRSVFREWRSYRGSGKRMQALIDLQSSTTNEHPPTGS